MNDKLRFEVEDRRYDYVAEYDTAGVVEHFGITTFYDLISAHGETILVNKDGRDIAIRWVRS